MTEENRTYITHLKVTDVPWHRLTTAYGRGTDFPAHLTVLEQMRDLASVKESLYELTTNMEHQSTLWHATPFGMVFCDTGKVTTKEERLEWPVTDEERNSEKGWGRFQNEQICRLTQNHTPQGQPKK